jgi:CcmD family protein
VSYLVGAYGFAILLIAGYVVYLVRQARSVAARLEEIEDGGPTAAS